MCGGTCGCGASLQMLVDWANDESINFFSKNSGPSSAPMPLHELTVCKTLKFEHFAPHFRVPLGTTRVTSHSVGPELQRSLFYLYILHYFERCLVRVRYADISLVGLVSGT